MDDPGNSGFKFTSWRELLEEVKKLPEDILDSRVIITLDENFADNLQAGDFLPMYSFRVLQKDANDIGGDTIEKGTLVLEPFDETYGRKSG